MSLYRTLTEVGQKFISKSNLFKYGFNLSPMYKRSTGKILNVSSTLQKIQITIPISYKNRNYMNSIFGGSMFAAVDPIPMIQLTQILGNDFVVWDKSAEILFKKPAKESLFAEFEFTNEELIDIRARVEVENEITIKKITLLTNKDASVVYCEVHKNIYIAKKEFYKQKLAKRKLVG